MKVKSEGFFRLVSGQHRSHPMAKSELARFRAMLTVRVAELERLARQRGGNTVERSADQLEEVQAGSEHALAVSNLDRECNQLRNSRGPPRRIREGSFGTCQQCDEDIHPKRLPAVPWVPFCIRFQEAVDRSLEEIQAPSGDLLGRAAWGITRERRGS
jgi:DnaK suppressor protein